MLRIRALSSIAIAAGMALAVLPAHAQATPPAKVKRQKVDARTMVPGPQAQDAAASDARAPSGLTRDERKEATLQARQEGALQPAGDAAEPREARSLPLASGAAQARPLPVAVESPSPSKKSARRKARSTSGETPA